MSDRVAGGVSRGGCAAYRAALCRAALSGAAGVHATAGEIFRAVNRQDPRASRATVYNSLKSLTRAGLVREVISEGKAARFDSSLHPHHHFVCEHCGEVEDIAWFELPAAGKHALGARQVRSFEVVFRGVCEKCGGAQPLIGETT
jgi:Fur family transcriptional regulator, peroxide stress response regulator